MSGVPFISIVDDDDPLRNSLNNLIRSFGFGVQGFPSAEAFLNSNQPGDTACLILDVRMPGMSGLDLQRQLIAIMQMMTREHGPSTPVRWTFCTNPSGKRRC